MVDDKPLAPHLRCKNCGAGHPLSAMFNGCRSCNAANEPPLLEVLYDYDWFRGRRLLDARRGRRGGVWSYKELLPLPSDHCEVTLQEGETPLVRLETSGPVASGSRTKPAIRPGRTRTASIPSRSQCAVARFPEGHGVDNRKSRAFLGGLCRQSGYGLPDFLRRAVTGSSAQHDPVLRRPRRRPEEGGVYTSHGSSTSWVRTP